MRTKPGILYSDYGIRFLGSIYLFVEGNVFCNAQTGNVVLLGLAIGSGKVRQAIYYLIPISAYLAGAFIS